MGLPDFLCIGAQKAGTSWLNSVLHEHPQIFMPPINELHFFDRMNRKKLRSRQLNLLRKAVNLERKKNDEADQGYIDYLEHLLTFSKPNIDWYKAAYSWPVDEGVRKGDITPSYLELSEKQVRQARRLLGPVKLILIVRRSADRLLSQLRMWATRDDRVDVPNNSQEWMDLFHEVFSKSPRGSYGQGVDHWRSQFGAENLLVLPYGDMRADSRSFINRVEDHLGIQRYTGYRLINEQIHVTKKLEVPQSVIAAAAALTAPEDDYIRQEFGEEFFQKTK